MKGQAFISLEDIKSSSRALNLLNGLIIKNKPVIVQYGRVQLNPGK